MFASQQAGNPKKPMTMTTTMMMKDNSKKNRDKKLTGIFRIFKRKRRSRDSSPVAKARPQDAPKTPDRPDHIPHEIDTGHESPRSIVSMLSLKSALEVAAERTSSVLQFRPPIRISNLLPSFSEGGESVERSLLGGNSDRGTPISRQPSSKKILFPMMDTGIPRRNLSSITRTRFFRNIVVNKFKSIDIDGSGTIDKDELYLGVLMVHLELAKYVGPSACQPASRPYVDTLFDSMDVDGNGHLDLDEFSTIMIILCSEITSRVFLQWSMTLMLIPFIAHYLVVAASSFYHLTRFIHPSFIIKYEEWTSELHEVGTRMISLLNLETFTSCLYTLLPNKVLIASSILTILLVPWLIDKSEHFFLSVGSKMRSNNKF